MTLTDSRRRQLIKFLEAQFGTYSSLQTFLDLNLRRNLHEVIPPSPMSEVRSALLRDALAKGYLDTLEKALRQVGFDPESDFIPESIDRKHQWEQWGDYYRQGRKSAAGRPQVYVLPYTHDDDEPKAFALRVFSRLQRRQDGNVREPLGMIELQGVLRESLETSFRKGLSDKIALDLDPEDCTVDKVESALKRYDYVIVQTRLDDCGFDRTIHFLQRLDAYWGALEDEGPQVFHFVYLKGRKISLDVKLQNLPPSVRLLPSLDKVRRDDVEEWLNTSQGIITLKKEARSILFGCGWLAAILGSARMNPVYHSARKWKAKRNKTS